MGHLSTAPTGKELSATIRTKTRGIIDMTVKGFTYGLITALAIGLALVVVGYHVPTLLNVATFTPVFTPANYRANLRRLFLSASPEALAGGSYWYTFASDVCGILARRFDTSRETVAHVVSALSPSNNWHQNLLDAIALFSALKTDTLDTYKANTYGPQKTKAIRIAETGHGPELIGLGDKTRNFARNLSGDLSAVTVDTHMLYAALGAVSTNWTSSIHITPKRYREIATAIQRIASNSGYLPAQMQAILWIAYKESFTKRQSTAAVAPF
jgi:hypothetical protein